MNVTRKRIVVAMSGGVDSSVTAALLKEQGHEVIGMTMQVWDHSSFNGDDSFGSCCSLDDVHDARRVADQIGIPFYTVNFEEEFRNLVVEDFVSEYFAGRTPNPCVRCNQLIKFDLLLSRARGLGAEYIATGHYARIADDDAGGYRLLKGVDPRKDQSYFLFAIRRDQLPSVLFPLGGMTKPEVRALATRYQLRVADKGESQEICFIPDDNYVRFLEEERGSGLLSGEIVDRQGTRLGRHDGIYRYTIGQRKGLGIAHAHPLYVTGVDASRRQVIVGGREELFSSGVVAGRMNWLIDTPAEPFFAECKIRYRHHPVRCTVTAVGEGAVEVLFNHPEKSVTPGQALVLYDGDRVLGGGWIESAIR